MDPHQRVALQVAAEALLDAGAISRRPGHASFIAGSVGSRVGVFVGAMMNSDWALLQAAGGAAATAYSAVGHAPSILANRISYVLGLKGPSMAIDTACSSSLVALDAAMHSLASGACDAAVVVGVNLLLSPHMFSEQCAARIVC